MRPLTFARGMLPAGSRRSPGAGRAACAQSIAVRIRREIDARMEGSYWVEKFQVKPARSSWIATFPARASRTPKSSDKSSLTLQMPPSSTEAVRNDPGNGKSGPVLAVHRREEEAVFGRHARARFLLQRAFAQHLLDEEPGVRDRVARLPGLAVERRFAPALQHDLATAGKAVVGDHGRSDGESFLALAQPPQRPQLELELPRLDDIRIGRVERPVGECGVRRRCQDQRKKDSKSGCSTSGVLQAEIILERSQFAIRSAPISPTERTPDSCMARTSSSRRISSARAAPASPAAQAP